MTVTLALGRPSIPRGRIAVQWRNTTAGLGDLSALSTGPAILTRLDVYASGLISMRTAAAVPDSGAGRGPNLSDLWKTSAAAMTIRIAGAPDLVLPGPDHTDNVRSDDEEPYIYEVSMRLGSWVDTVTRLDAGRLATATAVFDDGVGPATVLLAGAYVEAELQDGVWTDLTDDLIGPLVLSAGMDGNGPRDRVAAVGEFRFTLDGSDGRYKPRRSEVRPGWGWGTRIRVRTEHAARAVRTRWTGTVSGILPTAGEHGERLVQCTALDWMEHGQFKVRPPIQRNRRGDQILSAAVDELPAGSRPAGRDLDAGSEVYPYAMHDSRDGLALRTVMQRVAYSEAALVFVDGAGRLQYRNRLHAPEPAWEVTAAHMPDDGLQAPDDLDDAWNEILVTVHPIRVDSARRVLYELDQPFVVEGDQTLTLFLAYRNPDVEGQPVGAEDLGGHTHAANAAADGSGADRTGDIEVAISAAGVVAITTVRNRTARPAHVTSLTIRGRGIYDLQPITLIARDEAARYPRSLKYDASYQASTTVGQTLADLLLRTGAAAVACYHWPRSNKLDREGPPP